MELTHFGHSCLLARFTDGDAEATILFDPGNFSHGFEGITGLDAILGKVSLTAPTGVLGNLDTLMNSWTKTGTGQLASRRNANSHLQTELTARQAALQTQYDNAYNRYLMQFTQLQSLQSQMSGTTNMFQAMFSKSDS